MGVIFLSLKGLDHGGDAGAFVTHPDSLVPAAGRPKRKSCTVAKRTECNSHTAFPLTIRTLHIQIVQKSIREQFKHQKQGVFHAFPCSSHSARLLLILIYNLNSSYE